MRPQHPIHPDCRRALEKDRTFAYVDQRHARQRGDDEDNDHGGEDHGDGDDDDDDDDGEVVDKNADNSSLVICA